MEAQPHDELFLKEPQAAQAHFFLWDRASEVIGRNIPELLVY